MRTINDKRFKCSQLEAWFFLYYLAEKNEIKRLQLYLLFFNNNLSKNNSKKAFGPTKLDENSDFSFL